MLPIRKFLSAFGLLTIIRTEFNKIKPPRELSPHKKSISYADCLMSAFAMFSLKYPSLLQFDTSHRLDPQVRHNLGTLYGIEQIPCDTYMRERLDEGVPSTLRKIYKRLFAFLQRGKALEQYRYLNGRYLLAGDGTGFFSSQKVHCDQCCLRHEHKFSIKIKKRMPVLSLSLTARSYILANPLDLSFVLHYVDENKDIITVSINDVEGLSRHLDGKKAYKELSKEDKLSIKSAI
jgi:hypothetical protein